MSEQYIIEEETLTDIADSIRSVEGSSEAIQVSSYASRILNLAGSGGVMDAANSIRCDLIGDNLKIDDISSLPHYLYANVYSKNLFKNFSVDYSSDSDSYPIFEFGTFGDTSLSYQRANSSLNSAKAYCVCDIKGGYNVIFSVKGQTSSFLRIEDSEGKILAKGTNEISFVAETDMEGVVFSIFFPQYCIKENLSDVQVEYGEIKTDYSYYSTTTTDFAINPYEFLSDTQNCSVEISSDVIELTQSGSESGYSTYLINDLDCNFTNRKVTFSIDEFTCSSETATPCVLIKVYEKSATTSSYYLTADNPSITIEFDYVAYIEISLMIDKNSASENGTIATFKNVAVNLLPVEVTINGVDYQVADDGSVISDSGIVSAKPTTASVKSGYNIILNYAHDTKSYIDDSTSDVSDIAARLEVVETTSTNNKGDIEKLDDSQTTQDEKIANMDSEIENFSTKAIRSDNDYIYRIDDISSKAKLGINFEKWDSLLYIKNKNLCILGSKFNVGATGTSNGITWTALEDGSFSVKGLAEADEYAMSDSMILPAGTYTVSGCPIISGATIETCIRIYSWDDNLDAKIELLATDTGAGATFTLSEFTSIRLQIEWEIGINYSHKYYPQIELGTAKTSYENWRYDTVIGGTGLEVTENVFYPTTTIFAESTGTVIKEISYQKNIAASFEQKMIERSMKEHDVGTLFFTMAEINPADVFGFGTWILIAENRMLIGAGGGYEAGVEGGDEYHTHETAFRFASYYNEVVLENQESTGVVNYDVNGNKTTTGNTRVDYTSADSENNYYNSSTEASKTASGQIGVYETKGNVSYASNLPPYLGVYIWQRIA